MICDEKELLSKSKEIKSIVTEVSTLMEKTSNALTTATNIGVNDPKVKPLLLEMAKDILTLRTSYLSMGQSVYGELRAFASTVNSEDNFKFGAEFDNVLLQKIDTFFSLND